jgi:hypothetical protein
MHPKSETEFRALARKCVAKHGEDAWEVFHTEASVRAGRAFTVGQ